MRHRDDYAAALARFESGAADILLGTQMVAKGLDFPRVRLVGVIDADAALSLPDFRAAERVLQLVVQVVGRAGRREGTSLALVQTAEPTPRVIRHALCLDYEHFAAEELEQRRGLFYPPWAKMVRLLCLDGRPGRARAAAQRLSQTLGEVAQRVSADLRVEPAEACTVPRLREMLRYQVLVRGPRDGTVQKLLHEARAARVLRPNVTRFTIDVDPVDLL
jgi:primosomal protein N' (replication factor Y)